MWKFDDAEKQAVWDSIIAEQSHWFEVSVVIGDKGLLINERGNVITFAGLGIRVAQGDAESGFRGNYIMSLSTQYRAFSGEQPSVGACLSSELDLTMIRPAGSIPRMAIIIPYVRATDGTQTSDWVPQGHYFIDTREYSQNDDNLNLVTIHAYDGMLMTEQDYPDTTHTWPMVDTDVVQEIADYLQVGVDPRTWDVMTMGYNISAPLGYSMREVLSNIAAAYCGNWIMNYDGELLLVKVNSYPEETNLLITEDGYYITIGGDRILVSAV